MKTISIPVNDRPALLARVLESLRTCPQWRDWRLFFSCEPPLLEVTRQLLTTLPNAVMEVNATKLGCWHNTFHAAALALSAGSTLNLYLEDDYLLSPDALTLAEQWSAADTPGVLCLRRPHISQSLDSPARVAPCQSGLFGCGFAWRAADWPTVRETWMRPAAMWDLAMEALPLPEWRPLVNRSLGIGFIGTHTRGGADQNLFGPAYSGAPITRFHFTL